MKQYPSIPGKITKTNVWAFDKLDGSNIRAEWSRKKGFYKFGSRNRLIDENDLQFGEAVHLIEQQQDVLEAIFQKHGWERTVAFFEYWGENSFAGSHEDEDHKVTLIDVNVYKRGMIEPQQFVQMFGDRVEIPNVLHKGVINEQLITDVKNGTLDGMTFEGIVCKFKHKNAMKMFKVKNREWINKLKDKCDGNDALFRRLA